MIMNAFALPTPTCIVTDPAKKRVGSRVDFILYLHSQTSDRERELLVTLLWEFQPFCAYLRLPQFCW